MHNLTVHHFGMPTHVLSLCRAKSFYLQWYSIRATDRLHQLLGVGQGSPGLRELMCKPFAVLAL